MKKVLLITLFSTLFCSALTAQIRVGGMLGTGTDIDRWGLGINAEYLFNEKMGVAPKLFFYFPEDTGVGKISFWELNADFHYYFLSEDVVSVYGLAGLNFLFGKINYDNDLFLDDRSDSDVGLNLGVGANFFVGKVIPFAELKYVAGGADQAVIFLGVKFPIAE
ncbi:outer membrane beta-barrel protein [Chryseosolibacter indicus]|uniref:Outer membrane beta-barrel protein n=1 Tax=Chryseosolibacter indicus TaxID=2782351 RepID=A0ABS5VMY6_9BACT|nr:outer membrane beta-barrel protein [Chryseosolibacter indicus]MBT1702812.1 outer membrane beta-barrel protein [Chryseosolibacter indicus]